MAENKGKFYCNGKKDYCDKDDYEGCGFFNGEGGKHEKEKYCSNCKHDSKQISESPCNECCNAYTSKFEAKTNFEHITESPEMLARVITAMLHENDMKLIKKLDDAGVKCDLVELDTELQVKIHKEWLESEVQNNG